MPIAQNTALFSLLGTTYGGDGRTTFALPNLQGRVPLHEGHGPGLSQRFPSGIRWQRHRHPPRERDAGARACAHGVRRRRLRPLANCSPTRAAASNSYAPPSGPQALLASTVTAEAGGDAPHTNMAPYLVVYYCIALQGIFPQRP